AGRGDGLQQRGGRGGGDLFGHAAGDDLAQDGVQPAGGLAAEPGQVPVPRACQVFCVSNGLPALSLLVAVSGGGSDREPVAEPDGEGVEGAFPAEGAGAAFAALEGVPFAVDVPAGDVADAEVEQLDGGLVAGEVTPVAGDLAELVVEGFDGVGGA